ncbi:hypothetical protein ACFWYW_41690 [Nonomuraea sp. NPDC059023]
MKSKLTIRRAGIVSFGSAPTDAIRIIAALPAEWHTELDIIDSGEIVLTIRGVTAEGALDKVGPVLTHPAYSHLSVVACETQR